MWDIWNISYKIIKKSTFSKLSRKIKISISLEKEICDADFCGKILQQEEKKKLFNQKWQINTCVRVIRYNNQKYGQYSQYGIWKFTYSAFPVTHIILLCCWLAGWLNLIILGRFLSFSEHLRMRIRTKNRVNCETDSVTTKTTQQPQKDLR